MSEEELAAQSSPSFQSTLEHALKTLLDDIGVRREVRFHFISTTFVVRQQSNINLSLPSGKVSSGHKLQSLKSLIYGILPGCKTLNTKLYSISILSNFSDVMLVLRKTNL